MAWTMKTPEGYVKDDIKKYLESIGAYFFMPVQMGRGKRTLDLLVCLRGRFVAIEVKREGATATKLQETIMQEIETSGGLAFCVDSLDLLKRRLQQHAMLPCPK